MAHEAHRRLTPPASTQPPSSLRTATGHIQQPAQRPKDNLWAAVVLAGGAVRSNSPQPL